MLFTIEIRDYEAGEEPDPLTTGRIERVIQKMLDRDGSDGVVIVTNKTGAITNELVQAACLAYGPHAFPERMRASLEAVWPLRTTDGG